MNQQQEDTRKWYQKKRFLVPSALGGLLLFSGLVSSSTPPSVPVQVDDAHESAALQTTVNSSSSVSYVASTSTRPHASSTASSSVTHAATTTHLSNDKHYTNVDGQSVHAPAHADAVPAGASAQCRDGSYSFNLNHRGTCSHHGGVARWL